MSDTSSPTWLKRDALGLGLRTAHHNYLFKHWPAVDYFEAITENFLGDAPLPRARLAAVRARYPLVLHGVGMNLLGADPLDERYLDALCRLADEVDAPFVTDHLCWSASGGASHHDLLPVPYVPELIEIAAERAAHVQRRLGRPFGIENLSSYVSFRRSTMTEWEFYTAVVRASGCWFMLDVNNVFVSSHNHGFDPVEYLRAIDFSRVLQVHIAGHSEEPDGSLVDTHDHPVRDAVWSLYALAWRMGGPFPTLLEWDDAIPAMPACLAELAKARSVREAPAPSPPWLAELQRRFGATIRAPLDRSTGTLTATTDAYPATNDALDGAFGPAASRLAVYNRQYWFRLLTAMQSAFPLTASLLGHWTFNDYAARFFTARPPPSWDLDHALDGFEEFLEEAIDGSPLHEALSECARIEALWRRLFRAPAAAPFRPDPADAARILDARLVPSPCTAVVFERWPLLELKHARAGVLGEEAIALPPRLEAPRWWALAREPDGIRQLPLEAREGELLSLLASHTLRDALALLESRCGEGARSTLPAQAQRWLAKSVERGLWSGLAFEPES